VEALHETTVIRPSFGEGRELVVHYPSFAKHELDAVLGVVRI